MTLSFFNSRLRNVSALLGLWIVAISFVPLAFAENPKDTFILELESRQDEVGYSYDALSYRVSNIDANDPRKKPPNDKDGKPIYEGADTLLDNAEKAKDAFVDLPAKDHVIQDSQNEDVFTADDTFLSNEKAAIEAINAVNRFLVSPVQPGAESLGKKGTTPRGNLVTEFIPQLIRLMFRFTSLAILVSFVVSGVLFIIAFDNQEYADKAKRMLYYSLIGFAFVTLAYAIVKGLTQVNYFGII